MLTDHLHSGSPGRVSRGRGEISPDRGRAAMDWVDLARVACRTGLPAGFEISQLARSEVPELVAALQQWYPEIRAGAARCYLDEAFYARHVFLAGESGSDRDVAVMVTRKNGELAAMWSCERNRDTRALYGRLGVIAPPHQGLRLTRAVMCLGEEVGRAMGAGLLYGLATLRHPFMQRTLEGLGWQLVGVAPYDREEVTPGVVKRVYEALYVKVLADAADVLPPAPENLTPRVREWFHRLYSPVDGETIDAAPSSDPAAQSRLS